MSLALFFELEKIVGRQAMQHLCQQYMYECADGSGNRLWTDCSGHTISSIVHPPSFTTPIKKNDSSSVEGEGEGQGQGQGQVQINAPPRISRHRSNNILNELLEPLTPIPTPTRLLFNEPKE